MAAALATIVIGGDAVAAGVKLLTTIDIPGEELKLFDIGTVDAAAGRYYLADRSNKGVDIFDTKTSKYVGRVEGFVGVVMKDGKPFSSASGPNGVALDAKNQQLWVGDGDSTLKVIDLKSNPPKVSPDRRHQARRRIGGRQQGRDRARLQQRRQAGLRDLRLDGARPQDPGQGRSPGSN
jgi:DNA-binding beta-propeller fold protein YncE